MVPLRQTQLGLATIILTVILGLSSTGEGFKQELWLYTEEGNGLYFQNNAPDLTSYSSTLPKITRYCMRGMWALFTSANYEVSLGPNYFSPAGALTCNIFNATNANSLRHWGANESLTDAVSFYSRVFWKGEEILVTSNAKTDISIPILSLAVTGTAAWMFYEGKNLDGRFTCLRAPPGGQTFRYSSVLSDIVSIPTVGSIFKGCNAREIQLYRESHFM